MKHFLIILCTLACSLGVNAQDQKVLTGTLWDNWFVQAGLDMSLQNPYGCDFSEVFPKGKTFGVDVALGKWFTPHVALRGKVNWENGLSIFKNKHLEWIGPADDPQSNMDKGGYAVFCVDVPISVKNIFMDYNPDQKWNFYVYPRAGLGCNFAIHSASPTVGVGMGGTYKLKKRLSVYADMSYQVITSEFMGGVAGTGMSVSSGSNGFLALMWVCRWIWERVVESFKLYPHLLLIKSDAIPIDESR